MLAKWWPVICLTVVCLLSAIVVIAIERTRDPISRANSDRIQSGMTLNEVEGILGRKSDSTMTVAGSELGKVWLGSDGSSVLVTFDDRELAISRIFTAGGPVISIRSP